MTKLMIIGGGSHARVLAHTAKLLGYNPAFICEEVLDNHNAAWVKEAAFLANPDRSTKLICGIGSIGSLELRQKAIQRYVEKGFEFVSLVHPKAYVAPEVSLGKGIFIAQGVQVVAGSEIKDHVILNTGCLIDHDCCIGEGSHVAPGAVLSGGVQVGVGVHIGLGANVLQKVQIANGVVLGAGSVLLRSISEVNSTWVGVPAKKVKK